MSKVERSARPSRLARRASRADTPAPALEEIASEQSGRIRIAKLNVDDNPDTARRFDVMSIPTLLVFQDGQPVKRLVGAKGKGQLLQDLSEFIG